MEEDTDQRGKTEREEMKEDRKRRKKPPHGPRHLLLCNPYKDHMHTVLNYFEYNYKVFFSRTVKHFYRILLI